MEPSSQVAAFNTKIEADAAMARLVDEGIESFVIVDNLGGTFPMMQMTTGGYKVSVRGSDKDRAIEALEKQYPPIDSVPAAKVSSFQEVARVAGSARVARMRVAIYIVLVFAAVVAVALSTTQGTL